MKYLIASLLLLSNLFCVAQSDTNLLSSEIKDVTVFFSGAQITRSAKTGLAKGKHFLLIDKLPLEINQQSIQVKGNNDVQVLAVKYQTNYKDQGKKSPEVKAIFKKIENQKIKMKSLSNEIDIQKIEERLLLENSDISNKNKNISVEELSKMATFYKERLNKIRKDKLDMTVRLKDLQEELEEQYKTLNKLIVLDRKTYSQILVTVDCKKYTTLPIEFSYLTSAAGWEPLYDFRVENVSEPLKIIYNANIFQSSGEDWKDVNLTLSSTNPKQSGEIPELERFYLGSPTQKVRSTVSLQGASAITGRVFSANDGDAIAFCNVTILQGNKQIAGTTTDFDGLYTVKPLQPGYYTVKVSYVGFNAVSQNINISKDQVLLKDFALHKGVELQAVMIQEYSKPLFKKDQTTVQSTITRDEIETMAVRSVSKSNVRGQRYGSKVTFVDGVKVKQRELNNLIANSLKKGIAQLEYKIEVPYTILSDGEDYQLKIKEVSTPADYQYIAIPKLDPDAFLTAALINWNELDLLSGKASIYYEGTFKSETYLDVDKADDTLNISLGRDKSIFIQRELDKSNYERSFFGKDVKETVAWEIIVKNNKSAKINLKIEDQYPISNRDEYKSELEENGGAKVDKDSGKLTWELELEPNAKKEIKFKYFAKYPKY